MTAPYTFTAGSGPLLVSIPHCGTVIPDEIAEGMTRQARALADTDWHVDVLYDFAAGLGASVLAATHSRSVIDLNRGTDGAKLYPGLTETGLCPTETFDGESLYREGKEPDAPERLRRIGHYWQPYHDKLDATLSAIKEKYGFALLFDAHSIRRRAPRLFDGALPDLNLGTGAGTSCDPALSGRLHAIGRESGFSCVLDGRFKGGFITRHYGRPETGIHAIQLELAQDLYLDDGMPPALDAAKADRLRQTLAVLLKAMLQYRPS